MSKDTRIDKEDPYAYLRARHPLMATTFDIMDSQDLEFKDIDEEFDRYFLLYNNLRTTRALSNAILNAGSISALFVFLVNNFIL